ncbi:MAG: hypothetical protein Q8R86_10815 [Sulfuricurvum sp.]|nr:hypothetical protein [Sulfuricurvum sp.]
MNYDEFYGKSILLLGKTRSLNANEFATLLKLHDITLQTRFEEGVALIIEGKLMNPLEQIESTRLYELQAAPIVDITSIEKWLCTSIEPNRLLMSLKLSRDHDRLCDFIQNPYITDALFFKLLKLYDWHNEGLFDNDSNRDVTAAIIGRFYVDLERNHNVQYAMSGLAHLVEKYGNAELITAISQLSPIAKELKIPNDPSLKGVLDAMALHSNTPEPLLRSLLKERAYLVAHREPLALEKELLALEDETIQRTLAQNVMLSQEGADILEQKYPELIAAFTPLDEVRFERLMKSVIPCLIRDPFIVLDSVSEHGMTENGYGMTEDEYGMTVIVALASNSTLTVSMQERLMEMKNDAVFSALAQNSSLLHDHLETLFSLNHYSVELAANSSLSQYHLETLYGRGEGEILKALSVNISTPVAILYQLSLDQRYERGVKTNPSFGKHIQTTNLGWN